ncbi:MAG TPA: hypothetical protein QF753_01480 [Victivallales bacterium]|nr:hypothetical protein [Victivallales bacterium]
MTYKLRNTDYELQIRQQPPTINHQLSTNNEKGIATIFVLGIVALLMVLGVSFVDISIIEKKASINYNNSITSQIAGESALNRAVELMKIYSDKPSADYSEIMSYHDLKSGETLEEYTDGLDKLSTTINGITYYEYDSDYDPVTWVYLNNDDGVINTRIAYVVIPNQGKIDPSVAVDSGSNAANWDKIPPSDGNNGIGANGRPDSKNREITMIDNEGNYVIGRPGRNINELFIRTLEFDNRPKRKHKWKWGGKYWWWNKWNRKPWFKESYADRLSSVLSGYGGKLGVGSRWATYSHIYETLGITKSETKNYFKEVFYINQPKTPEAFWIDKSNDNLKTPAELYHRFNLTREDWDSFNNSVDNSPLLNESVQFSETDTEKINNAGLEWLKNWHSEGSFSDTERCQKQIAANLIDYSDTNSQATTDNENNPTYVGNEKCPYINEIRIQFRSKIQVQDQGQAGKRYSAQVVPEFTGVESVNMYDVTHGGINFIDIKAIIKMDWEYAVAGKIYSRSDQAEIMIDNANAFRITSNNQKFNDQSWLSSGWTNTNLQTNKIFITDLKIKKLTVKFVNYSNALFYDFSHIVDTDLVIDSKVTTSSKKNNINSYFNAQVNDPRQNLLPTDWTLAYGKKDINSLNAHNKNIYSPASGEDNTDYEKNATKPWLISTAYIRNGPMKSPWELGFIHRGAAWQTINLKRFNSDQGVKDDAGGDEYTLGDANILNQIKMTDDTEIYGKVNINSENVDVLKVLFQKIRVGSFEASQNINKYPGWLTNYELKADDAEELSNNLLELYENNGNKYFNSRAEILKGNNGFTKLITGIDTSLGLIQNSDAKQEEIIGKFINLTKASQGNLFTVIAIGETIKDFGDVTINSIKTKKGHFDLGADKILSSQKIFAIIKKNTNIDKKTNTYKFSILEFKYINE